MRFDPRPVRLSWHSHPPLAARGSPCVPGLGFEGQGVGFRVPPGHFCPPQRLLQRPPDAGFGVQGSKSRVQGAEFRVFGSHQGSVALGLLLGPGERWKGGPSPPNPKTQTLHPRV